MATFPKFLRKAAMVGLAVSAISLPVFGGSASAAPADPAPKPPAAVKAPALSPMAKLQMRRDRDTVCVNAHVQNIGWQGWRCTSDRRFAEVGTTGKSLRIEKLAFSTRRAGGLCAQAHVQDIGWQRAQCTSRWNETISVGTEGRSLRLEALRLKTRTGVCAQGHVQNVGWQNWQCTSRRSSQIEVGTVGKSLALEALRVRV